MSDFYQKIVTRKGLRVCPFCGKAVILTIKKYQLKPATMILKIEHWGRDTAECVFSQIERVVENEAQVKKFLADWNRRKG
jgi:hypothetical protein